MEPIAFVTDKFKGLAKWSQDLFGGLIRGRGEASDRRHPVLFFVFPFFGICRIPLEILILPQASSF